MFQAKYTQHTLSDGSIWEVELHTCTWRRLKEKPVAGITKIGQHEVTEIKRDAAQVGCTKVTRAEVEELLKKMDYAPREIDFNITRWPVDSEYIMFGIQHNSNGWIATDSQIKTQYEFPTYNNRSAGFCLDRAKAQKLFEFLGGALGYNCYFPETYGPSAIFTKV